ncbi:MAG: Polynucleotide 5'-hydroxyl-kinase grc3 [Caeruleum heppii]|nr:MAG: Polynucleotide 5'-hydroxyl-kinase grc3 [Caeruleum heppii]
MNKRKLENEHDGSQLSAFAARKLLRPSLDLPRGLSEQNGPTTDRPAGESQLIANGSNVAAQLLPNPVGQLSTFSLDDPCVSQDERDSFRVRLKPGEKLVAIGQFRLHILKGAVRLLGATLRYGTGPFRVSVPSTHALPAIIGLRNEGAVVSEVELTDLEDGLRRLGRMSPSLDRIWAQQPVTSPTHDSTHKGGRSFSILQTTLSDPLRRSLHSLDILKPWKTLMDQITSVDASDPPPVILVCGPKGSGKSTFGRILSNALLTRSLSSRSTPQQSSANKTPDPQEAVYFLDLDPGQPEFSPPGLLSLFHQTGPNLSPPFAHPVVCSGTLLHAHTIASNTPKADSAHYLSCAIDLLRRYRTSSSAECSPGTLPLVINWPGWIFGAGMECLIDFIKEAQPTHIIYLNGSPTSTPTSPDTAIEDLRAGLSQQQQETLHILPSATPSKRSRTPADLRTMQMQSYFHLAGRSGVDGHLTWNDTPLDAMAPLVVHYDGPNRGIEGVMVYHHDVADVHLPTVLNGAVVGVVVWEPSEPITEITRSTSPTPPPQYTMTTHPNHSIPSLRSSTSTPLPPSTSCCIGLALIRSLDTTTKTLHVLTPISDSVLQGIVDSGNGSEQKRRSIVLVLGGFERPEWAGREREWWRRRRRIGRGGGRVGDENEDEDDGDGDEEGSEDGGREPRGPERAQGISRSWLME